MIDQSTQTSQLFEDIQLQKYLEIFRRRKWWIVITATSFFVATLVVAIRLPNTYRAETVILVDPQKVPDSYVPATGNSTIADRLSTVRQEVMSPTRLKELLAETGLYAQDRAKGHDDLIVQRLQKSIQLEVVDSGGSRQSALRIGYTGLTPEEAALVPNKLASMVIRSSIRSREEQSSGTAEFLENELQETKKELEKKETEMGRIKSTYIMDLPESKQFHLEALTSLRNQLQASRDRVNRDQQEKVYLQSMVANTNTTVDLDADSDAAPRSPEEVRAQKLESRLAELRSRYGASHPDVRKAQIELERVRAKAAADEKLATPEQAPRPTRRAIHNPVIESQVNKIDQEIQEQAKLQKQMEEQISFHSSKLEREPIFEQQIAGLMRDYDTLRAHYNHLLDKKLSADMYTALVSHEEAERFVILDPAIVPTKPFAPNRFAYGLVALLGGLLIGIGLALGVELTDSSVRDEHEAANILGKAVIAGIPMIAIVGESRIRMLRAGGAMTVTIISAGALGLLVSYVMERLA